MNLLTFTVIGEPVGQGNLSLSRNRPGNGQLYHQNGKRLIPWRNAIKWSATGAINRSGMRERFPIIDWAVTLDVTVTLAKPKTSKNEWPITRNDSDWDHYARAVSDALTGVAWKDDSQVVDGATRKTYPGGHADALDTPGILVRVGIIAPSGGR